MKLPTELTLTIPASIMSVPGLNLIGRVILNHIHERPHCSNNDLATLTGLSERGIESTLARLKREGMIRSRGHGQARRLLLMFPVERHISCGENAETNSHTACGGNQKEDTHRERVVSTSTVRHTNGGIQPEEITHDLTNTKFVVKELDALNLCLPAGHFSLARKHLDRIRQWYSALCEKVPDIRGQSDECQRVFDDIIFALEAGWSGLKMLPSHDRERFVRLLLDVSPKRLAQLRQQVEAYKASGEDVDLKRLVVH